MNNDLPNALHYYEDNWHRYLAEGTSTFDFKVSKSHLDASLITTQGYISFTYEDIDYLFMVMIKNEDDYTLEVECDNLNLELINEQLNSYSNTAKHTLDWYIWNAAGLSSSAIVIGNNPFTDTKILTFDQAETKLSRLISIIQAWSGEFEFITTLKNNGTLNELTLNIYESGGVGEIRKDVTFYYGKNVAGINRTEDKTNIFNATTVTDSNGKYKWDNLEKSIQNSDGNLEFYKKLNEKTAYAPISKDLYPSQIKSDNSDQWIRKDFSIEAKSAEDLWDYAYKQLKENAYPQVTYDVSATSTSVRNKLGDGKRLNIGDTIIVYDENFDKGDGGLILSARVSEQEISFSNPLNDKLTFSNFVKLKSNISDNLIDRMKDLVDQNTPYRAELETTNGVQFKNSEGSTTLTARVYFGSDSAETLADSYSWTKDNVVVADVQEITVDASGIDEKAVYTYKAIINDKVVGTSSVTITNVNDGKASYTHMAWSNSADGMDGFTTVYPNLNLGDNTKTFVGAEGGNNLSGSIRIDPATQKTQDGDFNYLTYKPTRDNSDWFRFFLIPDPATPNMTKVTVIPNTNYTFSVWLKGTGQHTIYAYNSWTAPNTPWSLQINITSDWKLYTFTVTSKDVIPNNPVQFFIRSNNGTEINLKKPKVEQGSTATPYMPSSSEVTTADWPSYIGQYTDFTQADSTNPSDYTWSLIRGNDGNNGADGRSVTSIEQKYQVTKTGGTPTNSWEDEVWQVVIPQMTATNKYLWSITRTTFNQAPLTQDIVEQRAVYGDSGDNGEPGKIVSDKEPTTKFKGLTWKYIGATAFDASDGTNIQPNTEYYWNAKKWVLNQIDAQNINVDTLSAISENVGNITAGSITLDGDENNGASIKDGLVKTWGISVLSDSTYPDGNSYTSMGACLDSGGISYYSAPYGQTLTGDKAIDDPYKVATLRAVAHSNRENVNVGLVLNIINENYPLTVTSSAVINGDLTVTGKLTRPNKKVLLSGAYWMQAGQVVTPSKALSDCENGWLLHFTEYKSGMTGATKNGQNHYCYVPKESAQLADVGTSFPLVASDGTATLKYLYIQGTKITGNAANETANSKKFVLQHVLEY
ncbi:MAG: phage tail protein [Lactococcus lactis]